MTPCGSARRTVSPGQEDDAGPSLSSLDLPSDEMRGEEFDESRSR